MSLSVSGLIEILKDRAEPSSSRYIIVVFTEKGSGGVVLINEDVIPIMGYDVIGPTTVDTLEFVNILDKHDIYRYSLHEIIGDLSEAGLFINDTIESWETDLISRIQP